MEHSGVVTEDTNIAEPVYEKLDPRVVRLWRISQLIRSAVWLGVGLVAGVIGAGSELAPWWLVILGLTGLLALRVVLLLWQPVRAYHTWGYRLDGAVIEIRFGIWWRTMQLLPLSRLQHVDLHFGPLERAMGLATLTLHTAGTHEAVLVIPGLDATVAARLRDQLVVKGGDDGV